MGRKKKDISKYRARELSNVVAERLQLLRRMEHADDNGYVSCVTCDNVKHYKGGIQGGHFIERSKSPTKLREENIWPQCDSCNAAMGKFGKSTVAYKYYQHMCHFYGEDFVRELIKESNKNWKWCKPELMDMLDEINERIKEQEARIC